MDTENEIVKLYEKCHNITIEVIDLEMQILKLQIMQDKLKIRLNNTLIKVEEIKNKSDKEDGKNRES